MKRFISTWNRTSLIKRIAIGVVVGAVLGLLVPKFTVIGLLGCLLYTSPSPRDVEESRMPSSA